MSFLWYQLNNIGSLFIAHMYSNSSKYDQRSIPPIPPRTSTQTTLALGRGHARGDSILRTGSRHFASFSLCVSDSQSQRSKRRHTAPRCRRAPAASRERPAQPGTIASFPPVPTRRKVHPKPDGYHRRCCAVHPLAGQSTNLGLGDAAGLALCVSIVLELGGDTGASTNLRGVPRRLECGLTGSGSGTTLIPYARERYFENHKVMSVVEKRHKLYAGAASCARAVWSSRSSTSLTPSRPVSPAARADSRVRKLGRRVRSGRRLLVT